MTRQLIIADRVINDDSDAYVIAEIGHNHQGNLQTAKELFQAAADCGGEPGWAVGALRSTKAAGPANCGATSQWHISHSSAYLRYT